MLFISQLVSFNLATRTFNLPTRGLELVTRKFDLVTREFELVTCGFELVTCTYELVTSEFELVTRNSCFTFSVQLNIAYIFLFILILHSQREHSFAKIMPFRNSENATNWAINIFLS